MVSRLQRLEAGLDGVELVPTNGLLATLREQKDHEEIAAIAGSLDLMEKALAQVAGQDIVGKTEREVALMIVRAVGGFGGRGSGLRPHRGRRPQRGRTPRRADLPCHQGPASR